MIGRDGRHIKNILESLDINKEDDLKVRILKEKSVMEHKPTTECFVKVRTAEILELVKQRLIKAAQDTEKKRKAAAKKVR